MKVDAKCQDVPRVRRLWRAVMVLVVVLAVGLAPSAWAVNLNCWGKVLQIKKWPNSLAGKGFIGISFELTDGTKRTWLVCSTRPDLYNPDSTIEDCNHVLSLLAIAKGLGGDVLLTFESTETIPNTAGGTGAATCQEIAEWHGGIIAHITMVTVQ